MANEELKAEILEILAAADRPLIIREIVARSDLAEGRVSVSAALHPLVVEGDVERITYGDNGHFAYRLSAGQPGDIEDNQEKGGAEGQDTSPLATAEAADEPTGDKDAETSPAAEPVIQPTLTGRVRGWIAQCDQEFTTRDVVQALGEQRRTQPISGILFRELRAGRLRKRKVRGRAIWRTAQVAEPPRMSLTSPISEPLRVDYHKSSDTNDDRPASGPSSSPEPKPRFAVFNSGSMVLSDASGNTVEFNAEEAWELICWIACIDHAAMTGREDS